MPLYSLERAATQYLKNQGGVGFTVIPKSIPGVCFRRFIDYGDFDIRCRMVHFVRIESEDRVAVITFTTFGVDGGP